MRMKLNRVLALAFILALLWQNPVQAQKAPQLGYMYPPVVKVGAIHEVRLGGYDLTPDVQWFFHQEGIELIQTSNLGDYIITPPPYWTGPRMSVGNPLIAREFPATIQVAQDVPEGLSYFQTANANGISQTAAFLVRSGNEMVEQRWRDDPQLLESIPVGISGRLSRLTEVDRYRFTASQNGLVYVELHARRLGSNFNAMLKVEDDQNRCLVDVADTLGADCRFVFSVQRDRQYTLSLHDADFRGDASYVYHLALRNEPIVERSFPIAVPRGSRTEVEFLGWGLATGAAKLESLRRPIEIPSDFAASQWRQSIDTALGKLEVVLPITQQPERLVDAVASVGGVVEAGEGSFTLVKNFQGLEREHRYRWKVPAKTIWKIDLQAILFRSDLDLTLSLLDNTGKVILSSEDSVGSLDPSLEYRSDTESELTIVVRRLTRTEEELANRYLLMIRPQASDFSLTMEQSVPVVIGGKKEWIVKAERRGGHEAEIALEIIGLPEGVSLSGERKIPSGKNEVKLMVEVAPTAKAVAAPLRIVGESSIDGTVIRRQALASITKSIAPLRSEQMYVSAAVVSTTLTPPFDIFLLDKTRQRDTPRGATCIAEMDVVRKNGFEGEISIEMAAQQSRYLCGSHGLTLKVPPNTTRVEYGAWMSEWLGTEYTMRMATQGVAQVADPKGNLRYLVKATDAPITMIMEGALLKVATGQTIVTAKLGERLALPVKISRSPKLSEIVKVQFDIPLEIRDLCPASPLTLSTDQVEGLLLIEIPMETRLLGTWKIPVRAISHLSNWPVQSMCEVELRIEP